MEFTHASITFVDHLGQKFTMGLGYGTDLTNAGLLYQALLSRTNARAAQFSETHVIVPDPIELPVQTGHHTTVDQRAVCSLYEHQYQLSKTLQIPAPVDTIFAPRMKEGQRVKEDPDGIAIAAAVGDNFPAGPKDKSESWAVGAGSWDFVEGWLRSVK